MASSIGVLVVHGIGDQKKDYADAFIDHLQAGLDKMRLDLGRVEIEAAHWADVLRQRENALWSRMESGGKLRWDDLRRFVISTFGDAVAYQRTGNSGQDTYHNIHADVHKHMVALRDRVGADAPLVCLGHSLGSTVLSNMIWDAQKGRGLGDDDFTNFETLAGLVTFGSTLPLFTLPFDEPQPIVFPGKAVTGPLRDAARWINLYDPDDVLGYPLRPTSEAYAGVVSEDRAIEVGGLLEGWTPKAHQRYWTDKDFVEPVAELVAGLVASAKGTVTTTS